MMIPKSGQKYSDRFNANVPLDLRAVFNRICYVIPIDGVDCDPLCD